MTRSSCRIAGIPASEAESEGSHPSRGSSELSSWSLPAREEVPARAAARVAMAPRLLLPETPPSRRRCPRLRLLPSPRAAGAAAIRCAWTALAPMCRRAVRARESPIVISPAAGVSSAAWKTRSAVAGASASQKRDHARTAVGRTPIVVQAASAKARCAAAAAEPTATVAAGRQAALRAPSTDRSARAPAGGRKG